MKRAFSLLLVSAILSLLLTGCGSTSQLSSSGTASSGTGSSGTGTSGSGTNQTPETVPVSLTMTDDPPAGVSVLFFQVSLTAASLTPASGPAVSLITTPIQVDVSQLQALSAFLGAANVPAGTYNSLSLTFANPQLVIFNNSDQALASTCAVGSVCQLTPTIDNSATVDLSSAPFPVTIAANSPLGFLIDFHLNTIIQSDLSVNLQAANGVTIGQVPPSAPSQPPPFGSLTGTVESVSASANQFTFTVQTAWGKTFTIDTNSSTTYNDFPPSNVNVCAPAPIPCVLFADGQIVRVQVASVESDGDLLAAQVTCIQTSSQQTVVGTIVGIPPLPLPTGETIIQLILHQNPTASSNLPVGGMASVAVWATGTGGHSATTYSIDANGFTIPIGAFTTASSLTVGQTVQVTVEAGTLQLGPVSGPITQGGWGPPQKLSFTASNLQLEPSQLTATVSALTGYLTVPGSSTFTVENFPSIFSGPWFPIGPVNSQTVITTPQTTWQGFDPESFAGLADNDVVSVSGWFFPPIVFDNIAPQYDLPIVVAQSVTLHSNGRF